jgi:hypothetical protein
MTPDPGPEPALFPFSIWFQFQPLSEHPCPTFCLGVNPHVAAYPSGRVHRAVSPN